MSSPQDYGLPSNHDEFRDGQEESLLWAMRVEGVGVLEAPTGSGKTAIAAGSASEKSVLAVCRTKVLQVKNYSEEYGFDPLFGKDNYECIHEDAEYGATAGECLYSDRMSRCEVYSDCPYIVQRDIVRASRKASLNYAYYLRSKFFRECPHDVMFLDEGHQLSDLVLEWSGCTIDASTQQRWWLPEFPRIAASRSDDLPRMISAFGNLTVMDVVEQDDPIDLVREWLERAIRVMGKHVAALQSADSREQARKASHLQHKLETTRTAIDLCEDAWYIESGPRALQRLNRRSGVYEPTPGLVIRPLTARHHFPRLFTSSKSTVIMSATIGDFETFGEELGLSTFDHRRMQNPYPPEARPVFVLDAPRMGHKSGSAEYEKQAEVIAAAIESAPSSWCGMIHVTRKSEAPLLAGRLIELGLKGRVWIPPTSAQHCDLDCKLCLYGPNCTRGYLGTDEQAELWLLRRKMSPGAIMICWQFAEGMDGSGMINGVYYPELDEKICISAKVPFPYLGDPYERARQRYSGKFYLQRAAWTLEQSLGRTRRGRDFDYDTPTERRGLVAIADGNYTRVRKYLSQALQESLVKF